MPPDLFSYDKLRLVADDDGTHLFVGDESFPLGRVRAQDLYNLLLRAVYERVVDQISISNGPGNEVVVKVDNENLLGVKANKRHHYRMISIRTTASGITTEARVQMDLDQILDLSTKIRTYFDNFT